jgi:hypothetical protein
MSFAAEVPSPAVLHADVGAGLRITLSQLPPAALSTLKHAASMANPKFYELQRLRKSTWDTPRFVRGDDITLDDHLVLPRGLRHTVTTIVERAGSRVVVADVRKSGFRDRRRVYRHAEAGAGSRGRGDACPRRWCSGRATRVWQDCHGVRDHRRAGHLHPRPGRSKGGGRAAAYPRGTLLGMNADHTRNARIAEDIGRSRSPDCSCSVLVG